MRGENPERHGFASWNREGGIWWLACGLWLLAHALAVFFYASNFPYADDLGILDSVSQMLDPPENLSPLHVFLMPHNVHLPYFNQLVYVALYAFSGQINFSLMIGLGHVIAVLIAWQLSAGIQGHWRVNAVTCTCLVAVLNPLLWDNLYWAFTALQNYAVILFAFVALARYAHRSTPNVADIGWLILPGLVQANGVLLPLLVMLHQMCSRAPGFRRDYRWLLTASLSWLGLVCIYMLAFLGIDTDTTASVVSQGLDFSQTWLQWLQGLIYLAACVLGLLGSLWFEGDGWVLTLPTGMGLTMTLMYLLKGSRDPGLRFMGLAALFLALSVAVIALGRGIFTPFPELVTTSRYKAYSLVLLALVVVLAGLCRSRLLWLWLPVLLLSMLLGWQQLPNVRQRAVDLQHAYYHWLLDGGFGAARFRYVTPSPGVYVLRAHEQGFYSPFAAQPRDRKAQVQVLTDASCPLADTVVGRLDVHGSARALAWQLRLDTPYWQEGRPAWLLLCGNDGEVYQLQLPTQRMSHHHGYGYFLVLKASIADVLERKEVRVYARFQETDQWQRLQYAGPRADR